MKHITMKSGRLTRSLVVETPPFPKPGDLLNFDGEGADWTVTKVSAVRNVIAAFYGELTPLPFNKPKSQRAE